MKQAIDYINEKSYGTCGGTQVVRIRDAERAIQMAYTEGKTGRTAARKKQNWQDLRNQAAIANVQAILGNNELMMKIGERAESDGEIIHTTIAKCAIEHAEALIEELKGGKNEQ